MKMLAFVLATAVVAAAPAAATTVDISALNGTGTTVSLAAGTYTASFIAGTYSAWNPWGYVANCDGNGMNCSNGWVMSLGVDTGSAGTFDRTNGFAFGYPEVPGNNGRYATAAAALAAAQSGQGAAVAPVSQVANPAAYVPTTYPFTFTLAAAQDVNFFIADSPYGDNAGGVSINLTGGVPEPASWAMMIAGVGLAGGALRRRSARATALA